MQPDKLPKSIKQSDIIRVAFAYLEPSIRDDLLSRPKFLESTNNILTPSIGYMGSDAYFDQSHFFDTVQNVFTNGSPVDLVDTTGNSWNLSPSTRENRVAGKYPLLLKGRNGFEVELSNYEPLAKEKEIRLDFFDSLVKYCFYSKEHINQWQKILSNRNLSAIELEQFHKLVSMSPNLFSVTVQQHLDQSKIHPSVLIPNSTTYYELLIGKYDNSESISDYATGAASKLISELLHWDSYKGLKQCLKLSTHSAISSQINISPNLQENFEKILNEIIKSEDRVSQMGGIILGLDNFSDYPDVEPYLIELIQQIRDDNPEDTNSAFNKLNTLFVLVEGELARTKCLKDVPAFYRKLASITHATIIQQNLPITKFDFEKFSNWVHDGWGPYYYYQTLSNLQQDNRWYPDFTNPQILKDYFINRILNQLTKSKLEKSSKLVSIILGDSPSSLLLSRTMSPESFSGPVDGREFCTNLIPKELSKELKVRFRDRKPTENLTRLFLIWIIKFEDLNLYKYTEEFLIEMYNISELDLTNEDGISDILNNMSIIATVTKSENLMKHVRGLCLHLRKFYPDQLNILSEFQFCLTSAHAIENNDKRRNFIGDWITQLSFSIPKEKVVMFHFGLKRLCHVEPELWKYCSRAEAALSSCTNIGHKL